jgi:hypothetical protein
LFKKTTADDLSHFFHAPPVSIARPFPRHEQQPRKGKSMNYRILEITDEDENLIPRVIEYIAIDTWGRP